MLEKSVLKYADFVQKMWVDLTDLNSVAVLTSLSCILINNKCKLLFQHLYDIQVTTNNTRTFFNVGFLLGPNIDLITLVRLEYGWTGTRRDLGG